MFALFAGRIASISNADLSTAGEAASLCAVRKGHDAQGSARHLHSRPCSWNSRADCSLEHGADPV